MSRRTSSPNTHLATDSLSAAYCGQIRHDLGRRAGAFVASGAMIVTVLYAG